MTRNCDQVSSFPDSSNIAQSAFFDKREQPLTFQAALVMQESLVLLSVLSIFIADETNHLKITDEVKRKKYNDSESKKFMGLLFWCYDIGLL